MNVDMLLKTKWGVHMTRFEKVEHTKEGHTTINNTKVNTLCLIFENGDSLMFHQDNGYMIQVN